MGELNFGRVLRRGRLYLDRPAVLDLGTGHRASYGEHLDRVGRLASGLASLGVDPHDRVGVLAGGSSAYVELWQAALSGAAVLNPLNTRLAPDSFCQPR